MAPHAVPLQSPAQPAGDSAWPRALADAFTPKPFFPPAPPAGQTQHAAPPSSANATQTLSPSHPAARSSASDILKLRTEIARLDLLVKKLQTELQIERQYNQALESQLQNLTRSE